MPISSITDWVASEACATWLTSCESPIEPSTAEKASRTGTPAATKAPKANRRIRNVIGTESDSAFLKSLPIVSFSSCVELARPNSAIVKPRRCCCSPATASSSGCTRLSAVSDLPRMSNSTSCAWRSFETSPAAPVRRCWTCGIVRRRAMTDCTVERKAGSEAVSVDDLTSTLSFAGVLKPASPRICSARAVSPVDCSAIDSLCVPTARPSAIATITTTIQSAVAVFQCPALQRPARAARLSELTRMQPLSTNPSKTSSPKPETQL